MIVVDTNILVYLWLPGRKSEICQKLLIKDPIWYAPSLWRFEFKNVLIQYFRHDLIEKNSLPVIMREVSRFMNQNTYDAKDSLILELASLSECSAYDCEYVSLAKTLTIPLITNDTRILQVFPEIAYSIETYLE